MNIPPGRLQSKAKVLYRLACEPLSFPGDGGLIVFDVSHFEEALMNPRSVDS
jgi:hypothetical protein